MAQKAKFSPYQIPLIEGAKQWCIALLCLALLCLAKIGYEYHSYTNLPFDTPQEIKAQVLLQYKKTKPDKPNKPYTVMKLESSGHIFYITSKENLKDLQGRFVRVYGKVDKRCGFVEYFRSCFFIAFSISLMPKREFSAPLKQYFASQHQSQTQASLFGALFFADSLAIEWREVANKLGLAHIIAISGFHLGVLSAFLFGLFVLPYRFLQNRYFSYRNELYDLGGVILVFMCGYLVLLDFTPSFLRALVMGILGFLLLFWGLEIVNFKLLGLVGAICVALFPSAAFNIGFILSMSGVFYIFLFVKYCPKLPSVWNFVWYWVAFNVVIFFSITPLVHYFFPYFSPYQLVSIPVSLAFVVAFPLMIVLHIFGLGGIFDRWLDMVVDLQIPSIDYYLSLPLMACYVALSFGSIFSRKIYFAMLAFALIFWVYLLARFIGAT